jgi:CyaY protein
MTDSEYLALAEDTLDAIELAVEDLCDDGDLDIDVQRAGNVLTLVFPNATKIIVNTQRPVHEIWVAAKSGGYHYKYVDGAWRDTRSSIELFAALSDAASEQAAERIEIVRKRPLAD